MFIRTDLFKAFEKESLYQAIYSSFSLLQKQIILGVNQGVGERKFTPAEALNGLSHLSDPERFRK